MSTAILLSGGIDSIALAYLERAPLAVTIDYGHRPARAEFQAAAQVCADLRIEHLPLAIDCASLGSGDLAGTAPLPVAPVREWWPFRNQLLVTFAAAAVLPRGVDRLLIGTVAGDQVHADGTARFVESLSGLLAIQEGGLQLDAPAIRWSSTELVQRSGVPIEILAWAHSCHVSNYACGRCRGCNKHRTTMKELGVGAY